MSHTVAILYKRMVGWLTRINMKTGCLPLPTQRSFYAEMHHLPANRLTANARARSVSAQASKRS